MRNSNFAPATSLNGMRKMPPATRVILVAWVLLVGGYAVVSLTVRPGPGLTTFGDGAQCVAAAFACIGLSLNAFTSDKRARIFWLLLAFGCGAWLAGQFIWTYFEVVLRRDVPNPFLGDVIFFLHPVPMMAALAAKPHDHRDDLNTRIGYLDFSLLLVWWVYLYLFVVIPWQYISPQVGAYGWGYDQLAAIENIVLVAGFALLLSRARGAWREVYAHLFSAALLYAAASYIANRAIDSGQNYYTGSPFDLPVIASFVWFGTAGIVAYGLKLQREPEPVTPREPNRWPARVAMAAVLSIPLMAIWCLWRSVNVPAVRTFRVGVTQVTLVVAALLMFLRQKLVDRDRMRLLEASRESIESLKHFQSQMVQTEKLVSIGQLAAGAAHEINNPLTGILGYSDLLVDDPALTERQKMVAEKIRTLARRIKSLVTSLLSFSRQVPSEKTMLDINVIIANALHLSNLDLRGEKIQAEVQPDPDLPSTLGDANHILQVFFNLLSNAVDALEEVGGGRLIVRTSHSNGKIMAEVSDTGPGVKSPQQVFDPFFTTKPVGKGTGLGLSICYGIIQEHGGRIECFNRPEGGATFIVQLPAVASPGAPEDGQVPVETKQI